MIRAISFSIGLLVLHPVSRAQSTGPKTVFWEISGNGLEQPSYIFGTIHIMPKDEFEAFESADSTLKTVSTLVLEMEIDVPLKTRIEWAKKLILPEGERLSDYMDDKKFEKLRSYALDSLEIKEMSFNNYLRLKPFAFYSALIPHVIGKKIEGYELHFSKIAKKKKIPVYGLEDFDFQLAIFDSIPNERQMELFFDEIPDMHTEMNEIISLYKKQDIYEMANSLDEEYSDYDKLEEQLLKKRNINWAGQLDSLIRTRSAFIAVGAAHLAGDYGLIKLMREKNYLLRPVMLKPEE